MGPNGLGRLGSLPQVVFLFWARLNGPYPLFGLLGYIEIGYIRGGLRARVILERPIGLEHLWFFSGLWIKLYSSSPSEVAYLVAQPPKGVPLGSWATG